MKKDFIIESRSRDLGGFSVNRSLPAPHKRQLGPFVFLDHMGPMKLDSQHALDVRPHPHIGLATVTYLFEGRGFHRDSLGSKQLIKPGDLNWMTAGRGIVHSERTPEEDRNSNQSLHGVQIWVGLPKEFEECEPSFIHWPQEKLPQFSLSKNLSMRLMIGEFQNHKSPVQVLSKTLFMDLQTDSKVIETLSFEESELGIFLISGEAQVNDLELKKEDLIVVADPQNVKVDLSAGARLIVIGGEAFPEPRYIWWNFVSSRQERIKEAAQAWKNQSIGQVQGETDFIPLPDIPFP
jgi:redox-sensitive bicupin YhaK (pirin superfamily)